VALAAALVAGASGAAAAPAPRFFLMGDGTLALANAHTNERARVRYRRPDGSYDTDALARVRHIFRSRGDGREGDVSLRLVELLSTLQQRARARELVVVSGYRSPDFNEALRGAGRRAAGGSLHTEGLAADLAFPRPELPRLWRLLRGLDCCGAGLYQREGFLHVDVGRPRFWEAATSRVSENLSAENARLFARTEFDRYAVGETLRVTLHAVTVPPVAVARAAMIVPDSGDAVPVQVERADGESTDTCLTLGSGDPLLVHGATSVRGRLALRTCEPRVGRTPATVEINPMAIDAPR
jgi:uncharacterized protein YcbK (DUF882 family)